MPSILGLDIATTTGFAVLDKNTNAIIKLGHFSIDKKSDLSNQLKSFRREIKDLIKIYQPTDIIIENVYQGINAITTAYLNQLRGIAIECIPLKSNLVLINVKTVRKSVLGDGSLTKLQVFDIITKKYNLIGLDFKTHNDEIDALLLANYGCCDNKQLSKKKI